MSQLEGFAAASLAPLASDRVTPAGNLGAYLQLPEELRTGDEAESVDMLVGSRLLGALGYSEGERGNNRQKDGSRPDFAVRIPGYHGRPWTIIENKSSRGISLTRHKQRLANYLGSTHAPLWSATTRPSRPSKSIRSVVRQTAVFDPVGLVGLAYWYAVYLLQHELVFGGMLRGIAQSIVPARAA